MFKDELVAKPALLALNKIDIDDGEKKAAELAQKVAHIEGIGYNIEIQLPCPLFNTLSALSKLFHVI